MGGNNTWRKKLTLSLNLHWKSPSRWDFCSNLRSITPTLWKETWKDGSWKCGGNSWRVQIRYTIHVSTSDRRRTHWRRLQCFGRDLSHWIPYFCVLFPYVRQEVSDIRIGGKLNDNSGKHQCRVWSATSSGTVNFWTFPDRSHTFYALVTAKWRPWCRFSLKECWVLVKKRIKRVGVYCLPWKYVRRLPWWQGLRLILDRYKWHAVWFEKVWSVWIPRRLFGELNPRLSWCLRLIFRARIKSLVFWKENQCWSATVLFACTGGPCTVLISGQKEQNSIRRCRDISYTCYRTRKIGSWRSMPCFKSFELGCLMECQLFSSDLFWIKPH